MDTFTHLTADGQSLTFAQLTLYDIFGDPKKRELNGLVPVYRHRLKLQLLDTMKLVEVDKEQIVCDLAAFDRQPVNFDTFLEFLDTPTGRLETLEYAWNKANAGKAMTVLPNSESDVVREKLFGPLGITFSATTKDESPPDAAPQTDGATYGDGGDVPNPPNPPIYSDPGMIGGALDGNISETAA